MQWSHGSNILRWNWLAVVIDSRVTTFVVAAALMHARNVFIMEASQGKHYICSTLQINYKHTNPTHKTPSEQSGASAMEYYSSMRVSSVKSNDFHQAKQTAQWELNRREFFKLGGRRGNSRANNNRSMNAKTRQSTLKVQLQKAKQKVKKRCWQLC